MQGQVCIDDHCWSAVALAASNRTQQLQYQIPLEATFLNSAYFAWLTTS